MARYGRAFAASGLTPADVDVVELYDAFTITPVLFLEDLGFCAKGEGGAFVSGGRIALGGELLSLLQGLSALAFTDCLQRALRGLLEFLQGLPGKALLQAELRVALGASDARNE